MVQLHHYPGTASTIVHLLLQEIGKPFELVVVDRPNNAHKTADYLRLNPNGLLPILVDGDLVLYETAAICLHLCDTNPALNLAPAVGSAQRAHFYKWLMWMTNTVQASLLLYFYPDRWVDAGQAEAAAQIRAHAQAKIEGLLAQADAQLAQTGGPWFLGADYTALDPYLFTLCRWTRNFKERPARSFEHLGPYLQRVLQRDATQKVLQIDQLALPVV